MTKNNSRKLSQWDNLSDVLTMFITSKTKASRTAKTEDTWYWYNFILDLCNVSKLFLVLEHETSGILIFFVTFFSSWPLKTCYSMEVYLGTSLRNGEKYTCVFPPHHLCFCIFLSFYGSELHNHLINDISINISDWMSCISFCIFIIVR